jgi:hypothetical protein
MLSTRLIGAGEVIHVEVRTDASYDRLASQIYSIYAKSPSVNTFEENLHLCPYKTKTTPLNVKPVLDLVPEVYRKHTQASLYEVGRIWKVSSDNKHLLHPFTRSTPISYNAQVYGYVRYLPGVNVTIQKRMEIGFSASSFRLVCEKACFMILARALLSNNNASSSSPVIDNSFDKEVIDKIFSYAHIASTYEGTELNRDARYVWELATGFNVVFPRDGLPETHPSIKLPLHHCFITPANFGNLPHFGEFAPIGGTYCETPRITDITIAAEENILFYLPFKSEVIEHCTSCIKTVAANLKSVEPTLISILRELVKSLEYESLFLKERGVPDDEFLGVIPESEVNTVLLAAKPTKDIADSAHEYFKGDFKVAATITINVPGNIKNYLLTPHSI